MRVPLREFCQARSGDKADTVNIALFAPDDATYELLEAQVTAARVRAHLGAYVTGEVIRYAAPNVRAFNFVCRGALDGGAAASLRSDNLGKTFGASVLRLQVDVPDGMVLPRRPHAPGPLSWP